MGLSSDPEKRDRQLANLRKGWQTNADRLASEPTPTPAPNPGTKSDLEVLDYGSKREPETEPKTKPKPKRKRASSPASSRKPPARKPAGEPGGDGGAGGGLWSELKAGFLGS